MRLCPVCRFCRKNPAVRHEGRAFSAGAAMPAIVGNVRSICYYFPRYILAQKKGRAGHKSVQKLLDSRGRCSDTLQDIPGGSPVAEDI